MNNTTIITIVILILLAGGAVFLFKSTTPTTVMAPTQTITPMLVGTENPNTMVITPTPTTSPESSVIASSSPSSIPVAGVTISITDTGFEPSTVTVKAGTPVTFVNNGQALHWPASDPHPTHGGLAGFDAKKGLATGETYTFTFTKVGTWGFHDHLNARNGGSVIVQ